MIDITKKTSIQCWVNAGSLSATSADISNFAVTTSQCGSLKAHTQAEIIKKIDDFILVS